MTGCLMCEMGSGVCTYGVSDSESQIMENVLTRLTLWVSNICELNVARYPFICVTDDRSQDMFLHKILPSNTYPS